MCRVVFAFHTTSKMHVASRWRDLRSLCYSLELVSTQICQYIAIDSLVNPFKGQMKFLCSYLDDSAGITYMWSSPTSRNEHSSTTFER